MQGQTFECIHCGDSTVWLIARPSKLLLPKGLYELAVKTWRHCAQPCVGIYVTSGGQWWRTLVHGFLVLFWLSGVLIEKKCQLDWGRGMGNMVNLSG